MIDPDRALRAYEDVLAVEYDEETEMARVVTMSDCYDVDMRETRHLCPDREYNDVSICKHLVASEVVRGHLDVPGGWFVTESLDDRTDETFALDTDNLGAARDHETLDSFASDGGFPDFEDYMENPEIMTDGGQVQTGNKPEGHDQWTVWDPEKEKAHNFEDRGEAEDRRDTAQEEFNVDAEVFGPGFLPDELAGDSDDEGDDNRAQAVNESTNVEAEVINHPPDGDGADEPDDSDEEPAEAEMVEATPAEPTPDFAGGMDISKDPLKVLPGWMKTDVSYSDRADSSTTVNKRGCQVIVEYLNLTVEPVDDEIIKAHETGFEYAHYAATVTKPDGRTFTAHGTARADSADQGEDAGWKLDMMAETRAYKRAVKMATGGGIEAFAKEQAELDQ